MIDILNHFGLSRAPFDSDPDGSMYFPTASTDEALATARFSVSARKGASVIVGESGFGKTILLQLLLREFLSTHEVLVAHGSRNSPDGLMIQMYVPALDGPSGAETGTASRVNPQPAGSTLLRQWQTCPGVHPLPRVLLVDDAEALTTDAWDDIASILCTEQRQDLDLEFVLIGTPRLLNVLAGSELLRIRRRIFRVSRLTAMSAPQTIGYVHHRIRTVGGAPTTLFPDALAPILHRFTRGNAAILNLICDNALLEAFSDGRTTVTPADVGNAAFALTGGPPAPTRDDSRSALDDADGALDADATGDLDGNRTNAGKLSPARLQRLEQRLAQALDSIRTARRRTSAASAGADGDLLLPEHAGADGMFVPSSTWTDQV